MWTLIVGSGRRLCARLVMPLLAHELPLHATEVAVHRILPRQLVVVAKVVDALVLVEVHCIHVVADPTDVDPCDIPVSVGLGLAPAAGSKDVVDGITKGGAEPNCALHAPASVVRAGARGRSADRLRHCSPAVAVSVSVIGRLRVEGSRSEEVYVV